MKVRFDKQFPVGKPAPRSFTAPAGRRCRAARPDQQIFSSSGPIHGQRGIALVVTLIMLAVITFLTIAFLVLTQRERGSVNTTTDSAIAKLAADTALDRAKVDLISPILAQTNSQMYDLLVSTNYSNPAGFNPSPSPQSNTFANVNFDYDINGNPLSQADFEQMLTNLFYSPRVPVFVTNRTAGGYDFQYYLNLNRNVTNTAGRFRPRFDPSGLVPNIVAVNGGGYATNGFINVMGDPQWIGILEHPDWPYSPSNRFIARYAYFAAPAGKTLDLNYIHNQAATRAIGPLDGFSRNQGVGTWEINLAAFLRDLNTNAWPGYNYVKWQPGYPANTGIAFDGARTLLGYRYGYNYGSLETAALQFPFSASAFANDGIDEFSDGPLMYGTKPVPEAPGEDPMPVGPNPGAWAGSDNTNHFFTPDDWFDPAKTGVPSPAPFLARLTLAQNQNDTYDRYTYYRMLAQLGTDSAPKDNRMNINYRNITNGVVVPGMETNLWSWGPLDFFTNAAQRMFADLNLRDAAGNLITVTNIPLYPTADYTPTVNRVLQLAANIYDATTNAPYPSIFRPVVTKFSTNGVTSVSVTGYEAVNGPNFVPSAATPPGLLTKPVTLERFATDTVTNSLGATNIYGLPWIIGAKKGFPNFNKLGVQSVFHITRKLQVTRPRNRGSDFTSYFIRQMYLVGLSNQVVAQVWNSYSNDYPRGVYVQVDGDMDIWLTNSDGVRIHYPTSLFGSAGAGSGNNLLTGLWQGTHVRQGGRDVRDPNPASFVVPMASSVIPLPTSVYTEGPVVYPVQNLKAADWATIPPNRFPHPQWGLNITNHLRCMIFDGSGGGGRLVDYVQLGDLTIHRDLSEEVRTPNNALGVDGMWSTNYASYFLDGGVPLPQSVINQLEISLGNLPASDADWRNQIDGLYGTRDKAIEAFQNFIYDGNVQTNTMQVPYTPTAEIADIRTWEANDPLVHYTAADMNYLAASNLVTRVLPPGSSFPNVMSNLWTYNSRFQPWGGNPRQGNAGDTNAYNMVVKDPAVRTSDDWDFPTNKLANVGWLGRVHRGTPWQTIYLKASDATNMPMWSKWTGNGVVWNANLVDAWLDRPSMDRRLFDSFTTAINENAARGQLSVNQTNLAAWSAVLSGVLVITNEPGSTNIFPTVIEPAGVYDATLATDKQPDKLVRIWQGINNARTNTVLFPQKVFLHKGDVLAAPELTESSPYLNYTGFQSANRSALSDEVVERIPQQIMSLLSCDNSPRFVIYSYGQALHPAPASVLTSGAYRGMVTNYQVTAETATRTVVRFDPVVSNGKTNYQAVTESFNVLPPD